MTTTALVKPGLRTIRLYGALAKIVGCRKLRAVVSSVSEAMQFLLANFPQIEGYLKGRFFKVKVANIALTEDDLKLPIGQTEEIHIIPAISGAGGNNGLTQILTGVVLIGVGLLVPFTAPFLVPLGIGLTLTGVATLLTPTPPDRPESSDARDSYSFNGLQQTSREGPPVPLVYGEIITGSIVLSVNIERDDEKLGTGDGEGIFEPGIGDNTYDLAQRYPGICWTYYSEVYYQFDSRCPCPSPTYPSCTTTPYTASFTMLFDTPNDSNPGGWFRATPPTAEAIDLLTLAGNYCSAAFRGYRFSWTELQRCSDGDEIDDDRQWEATSPGYAYEPAGYRVWQGPKPDQAVLNPDVPFRLVASSGTLTTPDLPNTYPNNPFE